jgi:hypothetical protein
MTAYYPAYQNPAYQRIYDDITQVQFQLDAALQNFLAQASHSLQRDQQVELKQSMENTQLELEKLKSQYLLMD